MIDADAAAIEKAQKEYKTLAAVVNIYTFALVWTSDELAAMLGYTTDELVGINAREITTVRPQDAVMELARLFTKKQEDAKELICKDGTVIPTHAKVHPFMVSHEPFIAITDVERDD